MRGAHCARVISAPAPGGKGPHQGLLWSALITLGCLLIFGYLKSRLTGQPPLWGAVKMAGTGAAAAGAAFYVARLFGG